MRRGVFWRMSPYLTDSRRSGSPAGTSLHVESPRGLSPLGAPRSVREPLDSYGSRCSAVSMTELPMGEECWKSVLIEWLQQAQRERGEANQDTAASEAQKATLIGWLQTAQHEGKTPAMQTYPLPAPPTAAQECVNLAQRLAGLDPAWESEKVQIEHIRFTMTALGCGCDGLKK